MNKKDKTIIRSEYEEIMLSELEDRVGKRCLQLLSNINRLHGVDIFKLFHDRVKATQFVGFVKIQGHMIQVVPKILGEDKLRNLHFLFHLLRYTEKINIKDNEVGLLDELKDDFFEILIYNYAKNLRELLRKDFKKIYVEYEENISFLKGKLIIGEQIKRNSINATTFCCRFEQFTEDNLLNKLFKYVSSILVKVSSSVSNKKLLEDILIYLCDVEYSRVTTADVDKIHFTRLNWAYKPIVNLCKLILQNMSVQFSSSRLETFVFMFDMNKLFEEFIFKFIKNNRSRLFIDDNDRIVYVKDQYYLGKLFKEFNMRVDVLIQCDSGKHVLLDAKYKNLSDEATHGDLSQADFYQMYAYSNSQVTKYKNIILMYPANEQNGGSSRTLIHDVSMGEHINIHIRRMDVSKIYDSENNKIDEVRLISELNENFKINSH